MKRKEFIKKFAIGGSILFTAPVLFNSCSDDSSDLPPDNNGGGGGNSNEIIVDLSQPAYSDLATVGGSVVSGSILIIRSSDTVYIALAKTCTHQGYQVNYEKANNLIRCSSGHGSTFSLTGGVTHGPATASLKKYNIVKEGNTLKIT